MKVSLRKRAQDGQEQAELNKTSQKIRQIVCENRGLTASSTAEQLNIDWETVRNILTERSRHEEGVCKNVPKGAHRRTKATKGHNPPRQFGEARWHFGPRHHRWWNMGLPIWLRNEVAKCTMEDCQFPTTKKKFRQSKWRVKTMLLTFFDIRGIVQYEFVPTGPTVNQVYYLEVLGRLCEKVRQKWPELFANNSWILHHDSAPAHMALSVREFLATLSTLKETTVVFSSEVCSTFTRISSQTLLSDHLCILLMINFEAKSYCLVCPDRL